MSSKPGTTKQPLNFTAAASLNFYGFSPVVGIEYIMGPIDFIPSFPMEWGLGVKGIFDIYFFTGYSGFGWSAAPVATLHKGLNFGEKLEFDVCVSPVSASTAEPITRDSTLVSRPSKRSAGNSTRILDHRGLRLHRLAVGLRSGDQARTVIASSARTR
jgi:hypothetical protein